MKYIVVLGDGMADYPVEALGGKTPLQVANKPHIDALAAQGYVGLVQTVPAGMAPGSDTANLAVLGYDPRLYYTGRSPFEAASMGVPLADGDLTFRCNLVTLSAAPVYENRIMLDHSADEISSAEAEILLAAISEQFSSAELSFYPGVSYRHLLVWPGAPTTWQLTPPHDILERPIGDYLPEGPAAAQVLAMMKDSIALLAEHPLNIERQKKGLRPANAIWIWGEGTKPQLPSFSEQYGLRGAVISAVDLIKGLGVCAGLDVLAVAGATGNLDTNFSGKVEAALAALQSGTDFVYLHLEAPDECGHRAETENKVKAIELLDQKVIQPLVAGMAASGEPYRLLFLPDHATPLALRTHTADPVPFLIYDSTTQVEQKVTQYDEVVAQDTGHFIGEGYTLMKQFLAPSQGGE